MANYHQICKRECIDKNELGVGTGGRVREDGTEEPRICIALDGPVINEDMDESLVSITVDVARDLYECLDKMRHLWEHLDKPSQRIEVSGELRAAERSLAFVRLLLCEQSNGFKTGASIPWRTLDAMRKEIDGALAEVSGVPKEHREHFDTLDARASRAFREVAEIRAKRQSVVQRAADNFGDPPPEDSARDRSRDVQVGIFGASCTEGDATKGESNV